MVEGNFRVLINQLVLAGAGTQQSQDISYPDLHRKAQVSIAGNGAVGLTGSFILYVL